MTALAILQMKEPVRAAWPAAGLPRVVWLGGKRFVRSAGISRHAGTVAHYREDVRRDSAHAYVLRDGTYLIDHTDDFNPAYSPLSHFVRDVLTVIAIPGLPP